VRKPHVGDHRLQRRGVVREVVQVAVHALKTSIKPAICGAPFFSLNHYAASSADARRPCSGRAANPCPIHALDEGRKLGNGHMDRSRHELRPAETICLQSLGEQAQARAVPPDNLHAIGALGSKDVKGAPEGIAASVAHERRQPVRAFAKIDRCRRQNNTSMWRDHARRAARNELDHPFCRHTGADAQDDAPRPMLARTASRLAAAALLGISLVPGVWRNEASLRAARRSRYYSLAPARRVCLLSMLIIQSMEKPTRRRDVEARQTALSTLAI
jgi:hypothetical protein